MQTQAYSGRYTCLSVCLSVCSLSISLPWFGLHNGLTCHVKEREMHRQKIPPHTAGATLWWRQGGCAEDYADRPEYTAEFYARHQTLEIISGLRAQRQTTSLCDRALAARCHNPDSRNKQEILHVCTKVRIYLTETVLTSSPIIQISTLITFKRTVSFAFFLFGDSKTSTQLDFKAMKS